MWAFYSYVHDFANSLFAYAIFQHSRGFVFETFERGIEVGKIFDRYQLNWLCETLRLAAYSLKNLLLLLLICIP